MININEIKALIKDGKTQRQAVEITGASIGTINKYYKLARIELAKDDRREEFQLTNAQKIQNAAQKIAAKEVGQVIEDTIKTTADYIMKNIDKVQPEFAMDWIAQMSGIAAKKGDK